MQERRVVFKFGVEYSTPHDDLRAVSQVVREIVEAREGAQLNRAHFAEFGASRRMELEGLLRSGRA
jgi:hypothetical protein